MDLKELKKYISEDTGRIESILSYFGFYGFNYPKQDEEIRFALPDGSNNTSCVIYLNEKLYGTIFSRGNFNGDIFHIIEEVSKRTLKDIFVLSASLTGFDTTGKAITVKQDPTIEMLKKYRKNNNSHAEGNKLYSKSILNDYVMLPTASVIEEGISPLVADMFNVAYDPRQDRNLFIHYDWKQTDKVVGIQGRINGMSSELANSLGIPKYWNYLKGYKKHLNLYGYAQNKDNINEQNIMIIYEAEKSVLKQATFEKGKGVGVALGNHYLSREQLKFIANNTNLECEIVFAYDNDIIHDKTERDMLAKSAKDMSTFRKTSIAYDVFNKLLGEKDSPVDKGYTIYKVIMEYRKEVV